MKVLQITTNYPCKENPIFGIFMKEQIDSLEKYGVENTIVFSNGLRSNPNIKKSAIFIHLKTALKLFFHLMKHRYDVIHCHSVLSGLILEIAGGLNKKNTLLSLQNDPENLDSSDGRFTNHLYPRFAKLIVKKQLKNQRSKFIYLPNGVNMNMFKPLDKKGCKLKLGLDPNKRYILFVDSNTFKARTQKRKDRFDSALQILKESFGHSNLEPLIMTKTPREEVPYWMNACDLYLLTSDEEGSPNAVKECMACNVPVVATPVGNIADLFYGVPECKISSTMEAQELASLAHEVLISDSDVNTRNKIFEKNLDMESIAKKLYKIYEELAAKD